ncbi:hypothetical protein R1flu_020985 [Riccia fluitans]|uniref:Uncharacterized protein n=1 Tax=Riccia fluitans TaxID=41844 RepID=A0ABD1ZNJ8_9MARC
MQNWMQLMTNEMNAKAMEWMMGGNFTDNSASYIFSIERIIDAKLLGLGSQLSVTQQPGTSCGIPVDLGAPSSQTTSDNVSSIPEAAKGNRKPRLLLDKKRKLEDDGSMNKYMLQSAMFMTGIRSLTKNGLPEPLINERP